MPRTSLKYAVRATARPNVGDCPPRRDAPHEWSRAEAPNAQRYRANVV